MNPMDLLTTINDFYDKAFNKLLIATFGIIAFIGVIIPVVVGWLQLRSLRAEKNSLLNELKAELSSERQDLENKINEAVENKIKSVKDHYEARFNEITVSIEKSSASANARAHHLQGNSVLDDNVGDLGVGDFCHAAIQFFKAGEEGNARRAIGVICQQCMPKFNADQCKEYKIEKDCESLIEEIEKHNGNSRYDDDIALIKKEMRNASIRASSKK